MLTDIKLKSLRGEAKAFKIADRDGMYAMVWPGGAISFRYDYRLNGRQETVTLGRYDAGRARDVCRDISELDYGIGLSLAEARLLLTRARRCVEVGESPARQKSEKRTQDAAAMTFGSWAERYFAEKDLAESTRAMRRSIYDRDILGAFGKLKLEEVTPAALLALCEKIKARNAPATAVHVREIVMHVFRFAQERGIRVDNPADVIRASAIATFKARDRALSPAEIGTFFRAMERVPTTPTLRLALRFVLLTMVRKSEFTEAKWTEVDFQAGTWTIPADRMKARRPHVVYLSRQALDILVALRSCFGASMYLHPGRYDHDLPLSAATLNRIVDATAKKIREDGTEFESLSVHDLRRTASTILHEAGFMADWIEKCLAHEQRGVRAVYNKAEHAGPRRVMLQAWADMVDAYCTGADPVPIVRAARLAAMEASI